MVRVRGARAIGRIAALVGGDHMEVLTDEDVVDQDITEGERIGILEGVAPSALVAAMHINVFEGIDVPRLLGTVSDERQDRLELLTRILAHSDDPMGDVEALEKIEHLVDVDDETFELMEGELLPEMVVKPRELTVAIDYEDGIPEKFGVNKTKGGGQTSAWDRIEFEPFEHSGVGKVEAHLHSDARTGNTEARVEVTMRPAVFLDGPKGIVRLQKLRQFILRGHHLDLDEDSGDLKYGKGKQYRTPGGGTGVYYDYNERMYVVVELQQNNVVMRAVMKDIDVEHPGSDDSDKREWTENTVKDQLRIMHRLGPDFITRAVRLLSSEDDKQPEFALDVVHKEYDLGQEESDDEDLGPYQPGSDAARTMNSAGFGIRSGPEDDIYIPEGMVIPEILNNDVLRKLYATTKKNLDPEFVFENIGGIDVQVAKMRLWAEAAMRHEEFQRDRLLPRTAVLLASEPGFGKTMTIQACAHLMGADYFKVGSSDINDQYAGNTEKFTRALFDMVRLVSTLGPVVLHLNEIDTLFSQRGGSGSSDYEIKQLGQVLTLLEERYPGVLIVGDTNHAESLDAALKRLGRIDDIIQIPRPDEAGLGLIIQKKLDFHTAEGSELVIADNYDLESIAEFCSQYKMNGTEINSAIERAILFRRLTVPAGSEHVPALTQQMILTELGEVKKLSLRRNPVGMADEGEAGIDRTVADFIRRIPGVSDGA